MAWLVGEGPVSALTSTLQPFDPFDPFHVQFHLARLCPLQEQKDE